MSASLVGSEMCIRDRPGQLAGACSSTLQHLRAHPGVAAARQTPRCSAPVSYTHLTLPTICSV
eukprot:6056469-Alexandrium_andersonii.AAC.1